MKEVFEKIKKRIEEKREYYYLNDDVFDTIAVEALDFACDVINEEVKNCNDGWIPCEERLPKINTKVMCFTSNKTFTFAEYGGPNSHYASEKDVWFSDRGWYRKDSIIAWQPLPQPYVKGE